MDCHMDAACEDVSQHHSSSKLESKATDSILRIISTAALPAHTQVSHASLFPGSNAQHLLMEAGPAAVLVAAAADLRGCEWFKPASDDATANTKTITHTAGASPATLMADEPNTQNSLMNAVGASPQRAEIESNLLSSGALGHGLHHVYEVVLSPSGDDALASSKLLLLSRSGLGLCHYLSGLVATKQPNSSSTHHQRVAEMTCKSAETGQHEVQEPLLQQQQQQAEGVLAAMAVCLLSDGEAAHKQLLSQETLDAVLHEQLRSRHAAAGKCLAATGLQGGLSTSSAADLTPVCGANSSQVSVGGALPSFGSSSTTLAANHYAESVCHTSAGDNGSNDGSNGGSRGQQWSAEKLSAAFWASEQGKNMKVRSHSSSGGSSNGDST